MRRVLRALQVLLIAWPGAAQALTIGISAPLSGPDAVFGDQVKLGASQAVADLDADGGFLGERAQVRAFDDAGEAKKAIAAAKSFVAGRVPVVIGPLSSAVAGPASSIYGESGVVEILPAAIAPSLTEHKIATLFRLAAPEDAQAPVAARLLARRFARVAILHDRTGPGKSLADAVRTLLKGGPAQEVFYGSLGDGGRDVSGLVARIKASGAQAVFWGGGPAEAGLLARQMRDAGVRAILVGGFALASDEFGTAAGAAADGTLVVFPRDPRSRPAAAGLLRRLQSRGQQPDGMVFYAYAAVQIVAQAAARARSLAPGTMAEAMHAATPFKTVLGDVAFDGRGDPVTPDLAVYVWHRGASGRMAIDDEAS